MLLAFLLACASAPAPAPDAAPARTPIRVALNWYPEPEFGGFYEAKLAGLYEKAGLDVTIVPGGPGAPTLELLGTGGAEVAITSADDLLLKRARGIQAVGLWPAFQDNPQGLMAHAEAGYATIEDIGKKPGARVAIEVGSPFQIWTWKRYGWEGRVEAVPYAGTVGAFLADPAFVQQGYVTSEPCVAEAQGAKVTFLGAASTGWNPYASLVAVADPPPAWADAFVAATAAGWAAYQKDPGRANAEILRLNDQMKPELIGCITAAQSPYVQGTEGLGAMSAARWDAVVDNLVTVGLLPAGSAAQGAYRLPPHP